MKINKIRGMKIDKVWDYENAFYWYSSKSRLNKILSHYELYKSIINIPGHIFEFGVFKAASLIRFASFRDALENETSRKIIGFDNFGKFPNKGIKLKSDLNFIKNWQNKAGYGLSKSEINKILKKKGFRNIELIKGNVFNTLRMFLKKNPETRIAILHLDMDVKEPTDFVLKSLYKNVVPGGLIIFDDYNTVAGESEAVDEFSKKHQLKIEKLPFYKIPSFIRKPI